MNLRAPGGCLIVLGLANAEAALSLWAPQPTGEAPGPSERRATKPGQRTPGRQESWEVPPPADSGPGLSWALALPRATLTLRGQGLLRVHLVVQACRGRGYRSWLEPGGGSPAALLPVPQPKPEPSTPHGGAQPPWWPLENPNLGATYSLGTRETERLRPGQDLGGGRKKTPEGRPVSYTHLTLPTKA